jgi:hypothetical protein
MKNVVVMREVATGADGSFTVSADFEATEPPSTLPATVWAFAHDHLPSSTNPHGRASRPTTSAPLVIELSPAATEEERARALNILIAAPATWQGRGSAPGCAGAADFLDQFLGEQLERLGFRERGGIWRPAKP